MATTTLMIRIPAWRMRMVKAVVVCAVIAARLGLFRQHHEKPLSDALVEFVARGFQVSA